MKIIFGLGNPGLEYVNTRHNVGYLFLDYLTDKADFILNKKFNALEYQMTNGSEKIIFVKPLSFMNLSGEVVSKYFNYYKINLDDILIVQDDLDIDIGNFKLTYNHGDGGHNGIKNIILNLKSKEFLRLKFGISKSNSDNVKDYVLGRLSSEELRNINDIFKLFENFITDYVNLSRDMLIGKYNSMILKDKE